VKALSAGLWAYWTEGRADGQLKHTAKKTNSLSLPSSLFWPLIPVGHCWG